MVFRALYRLSLVVLYALVPAVAVTAFQRREARVMGDHPRVEAGTWVALYATALAWTLGLIGLTAWAYGYYWTHPHGL